MKISVLIAAYRAAPTIAQAIASVQAQSHANWELIVVEDGSDDGTAAIVRAVTSAGPQSVRYENLGVNRGVAATRNRLLQLARGDAVAFLDADDWWSRDHLHRGAMHLTVGAGLVVTGVRTFDLATQQTIGEFRPPGLLEIDPVGALFDESVIITSSCVLMSRATHVTTGEFDPAFRIGEDRDYWLRAAIAGAAVKIEPALTCHYAKHLGSSMGQTRLVAAQAVRFYEKHRTLAAVPAARRRRLLSHSLTNEARLLRTDEPGASARRLWRAWRLTPGNPFVVAQLTLSCARVIFKRRPAPDTPPASILFVADELGGQCRYSGIHQLARFLRGERSVHLIHTPDTRLRRLVGKAWSLLRRGPVRNQSQAFTELAATWALATSPLAAVHFLVGENHDPYLSLPPGKQPVIATLHMPASVRTTPPPRTGRVHTLVLLTARERDFYAGAWGSRQTVVIPHGVDTDFFQPGSDPVPPTPSILVVGRFLRDFPLTAATVLLVAARHPTWNFDFVVPGDAWHGPDLAAVRALPGVRWHDRVDDEALRRLYQNSTCHLTPFKDCTANNALVESLACGLPIVTTDRGGVRDYGGGTVYPLAAAHTPEALADLCERYAAEPAWRTDIAAASRTFAVQTLAWPVIARRYLALYAQIERAPHSPSALAA
ncbi:MAG: glycosyltransferase [Undibacterium sp.]|nr:glycosyltransferase [Opitutaceae bacterium]